MADQQNDGFVRQRRNLMLASLVLLFSEATELKVEKISAFGTELLVGRPQAVAVALWVASLYWLIRYYQYARAGYHGTLRQSVQARIIQTLAPVALKRVLRAEPSLLEPFGNIDAVPRIEYSYGNDAEVMPNCLEVRLRLKKTTIDEHKSAAQDLGIKTIRLDGADLFWLRVRAWMYLILHTTLFTDLVLPYIVFSLPVLYGGYKAVRGLA